MNNVSPYCGLVDARITASDIDLPLNDKKIVILNFLLILMIQNSENVFLFSFFNN